MAPDTPIVRAVHGQIDPALLFPPDPEGLRAAGRTAAMVPQPHQHEAFATYELPVRVGVESEALVADVRRLGALRAKGFVHTAQGLRLVQGVGRRIELSAPTTMPPEALIGRIVVVTHRQETNPSASTQI
jgi:hypothetical protein